MVDRKHLRPSVRFQGETGWRTQTMQERRHTYTHTLTHRHTHTRTHMHTHTRLHIHTPLDFTEAEKCNSLSKEYILKVMLTVCYVKNQLRKTTLKTTEHNFLFTFVSTFSLSIEFIIFREFSVKQVETSTSGIWIIIINVTSFVPTGCQVLEKFMVCVCVFDAHLIVLQE